jgi:hypothetical protein
MARSLLATVAGITLLLVGVLIALYGLFAILYGGDSGGGDTYVTWAGHELDADLAGAISLVVGLAMLVAARLVVRRTRRNRHEGRARRP